MCRDAHNRLKYIGCVRFGTIVEGGRQGMIELTKLNEIKFTVNAEVIEMIEETPDTVLTLTTGKKIIVKESRQEVSNLVKLYKYEIFSGKNLE